MRSGAVLLSAVLAAAPGWTPAAPRPRPGGELRILLPGPVGELDPARASSPADLLAARALHATLLERDPAGGLRPALAEALPEVSADGRSLRVKLRAGLRFHDGAPVTAAEVAESLSRLLRPETGSPHAWLAAAIEGAELVREGRARVPAGLQVLSEVELRIQLAFPLPAFPLALASPPAAVVHAAGGPPAGAGPFRLSGRAPDGLQLAAFEGCAGGRPWMESAQLGWPDGPATARRLARGEAELGLRPEPVPNLPGADLGLHTEVLAAVSTRRLAGAAEPVRALLAHLDRAELARTLRGAAGPLGSLLPGGEPAPPPGRAPASGLPARLHLLAPASLRALADRIQVKLFDRGVRVAVEVVPDAALPARAAAGAHDIALLAVPLIGDDPGLILAQVASAVAGPLRGAQVLRDAALAGPAAAAALARQVEEELLAVPLALATLRASHRPGLQGLAPAPDGGFDPGDLWLLPERGPKP